MAGPIEVDCGFNPPSPDPPTPELLTVKKTAALMRVEVRTVRRWVALGRIRPIRAGLLGQLRFRRSELLQLIERSTFGGTNNVIAAKTDKPQDASMG